MTNKKGMTLVEVLVYVVLAGLLIAPVVMLMQNSSVSMARDAVNANLKMSGREILNIIYDDLKNTGYKVRPSNYSANDSVSYMNLTSTNSPTTPTPGSGQWSVPSVVLSALAATATVNNSANNSVAPCKTNSAVTAATIASKMGSDKISYLDFATIAKTTEICDPTANVTTAVIADSLEKRIGRKIESGDIDISSFTFANKIGGSTNQAYFDSVRVKVGRLKPDGSWKGIDTIWYHVRGNDQKLTRDISGVTETKTYVLAKNLKALKFRYSDDLETWFDAPTVANKNSVQYIKAILVLMDPKKLSPVKNQVIKVIDDAASPVVLQDTDKYLYERFEIVVPVPNNGLYP